MAPRGGGSLLHVEREAVQALAELDVAKQAAALHFEQQGIARVDLLERGPIGDDGVAVGKALHVAESAGRAVAREPPFQAPVESELDGLSLITSGAVVREEDHAVVGELVTVLPAAPGAVSAAHPACKSPLHVSRTVEDDDILEQVRIGELVFLE